MIPFVPSRDKHEVNTVYLDFGDTKTRNFGSRNRSRRFSVSFDGRTSVSNAGDDKFYTVNRAQKATDCSSAASRVDSLPKGFDFPTRVTQCGTSPGNYWNQIGGNVMTSSLIEEKSGECGAPVNRELAVELLKEYVKSLKDFSSLLQLRQHQETKETSTSPITTLASDKENTASAPTLLPVWTPQGAANKKQLSDFSSGDLHNRSSQSTFTRPSKSVPSDHYLPPARSASSQDCLSSSDSAKLNDIGKTDCLSTTTKNDTKPTTQQDLPNKFILRKL